MTLGSLLSPIPLPEKNKCNEDPVFPAINSCVNNLEVAHNAKNGIVEEDEREEKDEEEEEEGKKECEPLITADKDQELAPKRVKRQPVTRGNDFFYGSYN